VSLTRHNGTQTTSTCNPASRLLALTHAGPGQALETLTYAYDPAGNRTADTRNQDLHQYGYDLRDQLTQVQVPKAANKWKLEEAYTYDAVGNRLTDKAQHASQVDAANRLTTDGTFTYAYDANGNLTEKLRLADGAQTHYTYDAEDRLIGVLSPKVEVAFQYDPLGRRTEKRVIRWEDADGDSTPDPAEELPPRVTRYLYDGPAILATFTETGKERARYTHGPRIDEPLAELHRKQLTFYHADVLGSIIGLTDAQGRSLRQYHYEAFGLPEDSRSDRQPFRFTGREWDKEIGLYYYRARYYDPKSGRFLTPDPVPTGRVAGDGYPYVANAPTRFTDPTGEIGWVIVPIVVIAILSNTSDANAPDVGTATVPSSDATGLVVDVTTAVTLSYAVPPLFKGLKGLFCKPATAAGGAAQAIGSAPGSGGATIRGLGNITHQGPLSPDTALQSATSWLGGEYREIAPGVFRSADGLRQFRMTATDLLGAHGDIGAHIHFEALSPAGRVIENLHVPLAP